MKKWIVLFTIVLGLSSCRMPWESKKKGNKPPAVVYDDYGFDSEGIHRETGTKYDPRGFDQSGHQEDGSEFDSAGLTIDRSKYDRDGFDIQGYDRDGYDRNGFDIQGYDRDGYDRNGFNQVQNHRNGTEFDDNGFDINGFNRDYIHRNGTEFDGDGLTYFRLRWDREGFDVNGFDVLGRDREGYDSNGRDVRGFDRNGFYTNGTRFDYLGRDVDGYNRDGFDRYGYDRDGFNRDGFDHDGFHRNGTPFNEGGLTYWGVRYDENGFDRDGYDRREFNRDGIHRNGTRFNDAGYTVSFSRYDQDGYNRDGFDINGYDRDGFNDRGLNIRGFTRDGLWSDGTRYNNQGYDVDGYDREGYNSSGFDRRNFDRRGIHENGTRFNENEETAGGDLVNEFGFDSFGFDIKGLGTDAAKQHRANKAKEAMESLKSSGYALFDSIIMLDDIEPDFDSLREALQPYVGREFVTLPSDKDIYNDLILTKKNLNVLGNHLGVNISSLSHVEEKLGKLQLVIDYQKLFDEIDTENDIYLNFYNSLGKPEFLRDTHFPDESDNYLNEDIVRKKDYLILFLGSIKNNERNHRLTDEIHTTVEGFPTNGNSSEWFAEMRYKMHKIYEKLNDLNDGEKKTLLAHFLHAGKHCSDAKRDQIETALGLFNPDAKSDLDRQEAELAKNLEARMESTAAKEKAKVLSGRIDAAFEAATTGENADSWIEQESVTYKAATWDKYADRLGLRKKGSFYTNMTLSITDEALFGPGGYTPNKLIEKIRSENGKEILDTYLGSMQHVINFQEKVYKAVVIEKGFLKYSHRSNVTSR